MKPLIRVLTSCPRLVATLAMALFLPLAGSNLRATSGATISQPATSPTVWPATSVAFVASSTCDEASLADSSSVTYAWAFGDGGTGAGTSTNHAYASAGTYTATFTATWTTQTYIDGLHPHYVTSTYTYTASRVVTVVAKPVISSFTANTGSVQEGGAVTLAWSTSNATTLTISGVGAVTGTSVVVYPMSNTTYTLTASNAGGAVPPASVTVSTLPVAVSLSPGTASINYGGTVALAASASAANSGVTWTTTGGSLGGTTANGTTFTGTASGTFTVTATSVVEPSKTATASVTVAPVVVATPVPVPASGKAFVGGTVSFSAAVSGAANPGVSWTVNGGGTINASGVFTATTQGTWTVTATSLANPAKSATGTVQVVPLVVAISPASATVRMGQTQAFSASVTGAVGSPSQSVTWSVVESGGGTMAANGTYSAPTNVGGDFTVKAVSVQDPTCFGTVRVHVPGWVLHFKKDVVYVGTKEVAEIDAAGKTWVTFDDHLGSPRLMWDGTANPVKGTNLIEQKFMPFGESLANSTDAAKFGKGFTNHEQTDPSGLIYMQARFYAPWFGRFLSPDPARDQHFEETQSWNIYSYCENDPTMHFDPDGMAMQGPDGHDVARTVVNFTPVAGGVAMFRDGIRGTTHVGGQDVPLGTGARWFNGVVGGVTAVADVLTLGLDDEVTGPIREVVNLASTANALNNLRLAANANLQEKKEEKKDAKTEDKKADSKPEAKAGTAANGQATDKYGNKIGGSGKPQVHTKQHDSKKAAKDAARAEGKSAPEKHPSPANPKQGPHYHPTDASGEKLPNSTHHEYP